MESKTILPKAPPTKPYNLRSQTANINVDLEDHSILHLARTSDNKTEPLRYNKKRPRPDQKSPTKSAKRPKKVEESTSKGVECAICLDTEDSPEFQPVLCGHSFHKRCFDVWLQTGQCCPLCRTRVDPISVHYQWKFRCFVDNMRRWALRAFNG